MKSNIVFIILIILCTKAGITYAQSQEDRLIFHYLKISSALARSDFKKAEKHVKPLLIACHSINPGLEASAKNLEQAQNLDAIREAFSPFSDSLGVAIRTGKLKVSEDLYLIHCPMAFNDRGADWISDEAKVINPYFGDEMLHCGRVKSTLRKQEK